MSSISVLDTYTALRREISLTFAGALKDSALGPQQAIILYYLMNSPRAMSELSALTQADPAATTRTVAALEKADLVKRSADPVDARRTIIKLTAKGRRHADSAVDAREKIRTLIEETLNPAQLSEFRRLMELVTQGLQENRAKTQSK